MPAKKHARPEILTLPPEDAMPFDDVLRTILKAPVHHKKAPKAKPRRRSTVKRKK